jgi:hypothetical protein
MLQRNDNYAWVFAVIADCVGAVAMIALTVLSFSFGAVQRAYSRHALAKPVLVVCGVVYAALAVIALSVGIALHAWSAAGLLVATSSVVFVLFCWVADYLWTQEAARAAESETLSDVIGSDWRWG